LTQVEVSFSKPITPATGTNPANYSISGTNGAITIDGVVLDPSQSNVFLSVSSLSPDSF
jgi:hypothetical protein